jgi:hypothetical protein
MESQDLSLMSSTASNIGVMTLEQPTKIYLFLSSFIQRSPFLDLQQLQLYKPENGLLRLWELAKTTCFFKVHSTDQICFSKLRKNLQVNLISFTNLSLQSTALNLLQELYIVEQERDVKSLRRFYPVWALLVTFTMQKENQKKGLKFKKNG